MNDITSSKSVAIAVVEEQRQQDDSISSIVKKRSRNTTGNDDVVDHDNNVPSTNTDKLKSIEEMYKDNPLYIKQYQFLQSLSYNERNHFFSSNSMYGITPQRRSEIWDLQCQIGEDCIQQYSWVTPDIQCMKILHHYSPIIEIGCGANAYWCQQMILYGNIDVVGYDISPQYGGKIDLDDTVQASNENNGTSKNKFEVLRGGPEVLRMECNKNRTLFLCYPDENSSNNEGRQETSEQINDEINNDEDRDQEGEGPEQYSMAYECLQNYTGTYIIHVGELINPTTPIIASDSNIPYGRTSSYMFQEYLYSHYHCILVYNLSQHWLHTQQDCLTVWKRSSIDATTIVYSNDHDDEDKNSHDIGEDEKEEEVQYRYIPVDERLPINMAAPSVKHLLL